MTTTPNLAIAEVSASQDQKEVTINQALEQLDSALTATLDIDCTAGGTIAPTLANFQKYMRYRLTGTPAAGFTLQLPLTARFFLLRNESGKTATVQQTSSPGATATSLTANEQLLYADAGSTKNIRSVAAGATTFAALTDGPGALAGSGLKTVRVNSAGTALEYGPKASISVGAFQESAPTASARVARYVFVEAATFPANLAGSQVKVGTNATATAVIDVQKNGSSIGSISIATSGVATLTTTSGTVKSFAVGDVLDLVAPASPDATLALVTITLLANKD